MGRKKALNAEKAREAAEMYHKEGKSRREVIAHFRVSDQALKTAFSDMGLAFRTRSAATIANNKSRIGYLRKTQLITSVWDLGRPPRRTATP